MAPIRIALGLLWSGLARLAGVGPTSVLLAFAGGVFVMAFFSSNDPRRAFLRGAEPEPIPLGARFATPLEQALAALLPSTAGVGILALAALMFDPVVTALCGGISAGLGVAGILRAVRTDPALWFDRRAKRIYRR